MTADLNAGNAESWQWIREWVARPETWNEWRAPMLPVIDAAIAAGWNQYVRAGPSMEGLLFSTAEHHGQASYNVKFPFVIFGIDDSGMFIGWSDIQTFHVPRQKEHVTAENAMHTLRRYFAELWKLTKADQDLPSVLA